MVVLDIVVSILENFITLSFPSLYIQEKWKPGKYVATIILMILSFLLNTLHYPFLMSVPIVILILYCVMNYGNKAYYAIFYSMFIFLILGVLAIVNITIESICIDQLKENLFTNQDIYPICVIVNKIVFLLIFLYFKRHKTFLNNLYVDRKFLFLFTILEILLFEFTMAFVSILVDQKIELYQSMSMLMLLICILFIIYTQFNILLNSSQNLREINIREVMYQYDEDRYQELQRTYQKNQALEHDMRNHLNLLYQMMHNQEWKQAITYIETMKGMIKSKEMIHTGRKVFDYLLEMKMTVMKDKNIKFIFDIKDNLDFINDTDLCILFANLLDNSIEAVHELIDNSIILKVSRNHDFISIYLRNMYSLSNIKKNQKVFPTTKEDHYHHGLGIKNIESIVRKYHGEIDIEVNDMYETIIIFDVM